MSENQTSNREKSRAINPNHDEIFGCRINSELTQTQAAEKIYCSLRAWQQWEAGDRRMHPALFGLFLVKTGQT